MFNYFDHPFCNHFTIFVFILDIKKTYKKEKKNYNNFLFKLREKKEILKIYLKAIVFNSSTSTTVGISTFLFVNVSKYKRICIIISPMKDEDEYQEYKELHLRKKKKLYLAIVDDDKMDFLYFILFVLTNRPNMHPSFWGNNKKKKQSERLHPNNH